MLENKFIRERARWRCHPMLTSSSLTCEGLELQRRRHRDLSVPWSHNDPFSPLASPFQLRLNALRPNQPINHIQWTQPLRSGNASISGSAFPVQLHTAPAADQSSSKIPNLQRHITARSSAEPVIHRQWQSSTDNSIPPETELSYSLQFPLPLLLPDRLDECMRFKRLRLWGGNVSTDWLHSPPRSLAPTSPPILYFFSLLYIHFFLLYSYLAL